MGSIHVDGRSTGKTSSSVLVMLGFKSTSTFGCPAKLSGEDVANRASASAFEFLVHGIRVRLLVLKYCRRTFTYPAYAANWCSFVRKSPETWLTTN